METIKTDKNQHFMFTSCEGAFHHHEASLYAHETTFGEHKTTLYGNKVKFID